jgi:uncharacterized protein (TIGR02452 family)
MIPADPKVHVSTATAVFDGWVDQAKNKRTITGGNAWHLKQAFNRAVYDENKTPRTQQDAKIAFKQELSTMVQNNHLTNEIARLVENSALKAIGFGAPEQEPEEAPHVSVNIVTAERSFYDWVGAVEKEGNFTSKNARSVTNAFRKSIRDENDNARTTEDAKKAFNKELESMKKYFPSYPVSNIREQAVLAIDGKTTMHPTPASSNMQHDAVAWAEKYKDLQKQNDVGAQKGALVGIYEQTKLAIKNGITVEGVGFKQLDEKLIARAQQDTKVFADMSGVSLASPQQAAPTEISVVAGDMLDAALTLIQEGHHPVVLNMANKNHAGGGAKYGARAQEEDLFRRTDYSRSLSPQENPHLTSQLVGGKYEVPEFGAIYTPGVQVFRKSVVDGFAFVDPFPVSVIASAAYNLDKGTPSDYDNKVREKIRAI